MPASLKQAHTLKGQLETVSPTSLREDMAQPPMMGSSDAHTASGGYAVPSSGADSSTENTCHQHQH